jgi:hypothetical protein
VPEVQSGNSGFGSLDEQPWAVSIRTLADLNGLKIFSPSLTQTGSFSGMLRQVDGSIEGFVFLCCPNEGDLIGLIKSFFLLLRALFDVILHPSCCLMEA